MRSLNDDLMPSWLPQPDIVNFRDVGRPPQMTVWGRADHLT